MPLHRLEFPQIQTAGYGLHFNTRAADNRLKRADCDCDRFVICSFYRIQWVN